MTLCSIQLPIYICHNVFVNQSYCRKMNFLDATVERNDEAIYCIIYIINDIWIFRNGQTIDDGHRRS